MEANIVARSTAQNVAIAAPSEWPVMCSSLLSVGTDAFSIFTTDCVTFGFSCVAFHAWKKPL